MIDNIIAEVIVGLVFLLFPGFLWWGRRYIGDGTSASGKHTGLWNILLCLALYLFVALFAGYWLNNANGPLLLTDTTDIYEQLPTRSPPLYTPAVLEITDHPTHTVTATATRTNTPTLRPPVTPTSLQPPRNTPVVRPLATPTLSAYCQSNNIRITEPRYDQEFGRGDEINIRGAVYGREYEEIILEALVGRDRPDNGVEPPTATLSPWWWQIERLQIVGEPGTDVLLTMWAWSRAVNLPQQCRLGRCEVWLRIRAKLRDGNADVLPDTCLVRIILKRQ